MLALMLALNAAALTRADIDAASEKIRADNTLSTSLLNHARPVMLCTIKTMIAPRPGDQPDQENKAIDGKDFAKRMHIEPSKCGFGKEIEFWAKAAKVQFPEFSDKLSTAASTECLSYFIFDALIDEAH